MTKELTTTSVMLPHVRSVTGNMLDQLTAALGVDRSVVALDDQIDEVWSQLPRLLRRIPPPLRDDKVVKVCVAVASGLFDAAINYIWNATIVELRRRVIDFGLEVIPQILGDESFDEASLLDMKDAELLELCLKLNLVTVQGFFFLDQSRATRNSYSVAHPAEGAVDEDELINFISRCQKYALSDMHNPKGVDTRKLLSSVKNGRFTKGQLEAWEKRLRDTFDAQRELIFGMLHGVFCDPDSGEETRVNAISICRLFKRELTPRTRSSLVDRHQDYKAKGDERRSGASQLFFEDLGLMALLGDTEIHSIITSASRNLLRVHNDWNNFYSEPPFAERLVQLTSDVGVPESAQAVFVETVVACGIGNGYGVSNAAMPSYRAMVRSFSPKEIRIMLGLPRKAGMVSSRLKSRDDCRENFRRLVGLVDISSVPASVMTTYEKWTSRD